MVGHVEDQVLAHDGETDEGNVSDRPELAIVCVELGGHGMLRSADFT